MSDVVDVVDVVGLARAVVDRPDDAGAAAALAVVIGAELAREPGASWRRFSPHVQAVLGDQATAVDVAIVAALLGVLAREPGWLDGEPRFVDLAARVRAYPRIGDGARGVLAAIPLSRAIAAVDRYPRRAPRVTRGPLPERRDFAARYRGGDRAVWTELVGHAAAISLYPELREDACTVAAELFERAATAAAAAGVPCEPASAARDEVIARLAAAVGPLPIALAACLHVGGPALPPAGELARLLDAHDARVTRSHREIVGPLEVPVRGGGCIELPALGLADAVDPVVRGAARRLVDHLRALLASDAF